MLENQVFGILTYFVKFFMCETNLFSLDLSENFFLVQSVKRKRSGQECVHDNS